MINQIRWTITSFCQATIAHGATVLALNSCDWLKERLLSDRNRTLQVYRSCNPISNCQRPYIYHYSKINTRETVGHPELCPRHPKLTTSTSRLDHSFCRGTPSVFFLFLRHHYITWTHTQMIKWQCWNLLNGFLVAEVDCHSFQCLKCVCSSGNAEGTMVWSVLKPGDRPNVLSVWQEITHRDRWATLSLREIKIPLFFFRTKKTWPGHA